MLRVCKRVYRVFLLGLLMAAEPSSALAQTPAPAPNEGVLRAVGVYEGVLRSSIALGGQKLAEETRKVAPGVVLITDPPVIRNFRVPGGLHFDVQAPNISITSTLIDMISRSQPRAGRARTVANGGVVNPDQMTVTPGPDFDPDAMYSKYVREALIDAVLDGSGVLNLKDDEFLIVSASGMDLPYSNTLYRDKKLILSIAGVHLSAYRQGRLTREQAKEQIAEDRW
jgi:hypothetical protein